MSLYICACITCIVYVYMCTHTYTYLHLYMCTHTYTYLHQVYCDKNIPKFKDMGPLPAPALAALQKL